MSQHSQQVLGEVYALTSKLDVHIFIQNAWLWIVPKKKQFLTKIILAKFVQDMYTNPCCGMIAVKREVAAETKVTAGFPWSECQVRKLTTSHCTNNQVYHRIETTWK